METADIQNLTATFEAHAQQTDAGIEYWLARDLQLLLGYSKWDNFLNAVSTAQIVCELIGPSVKDHFADVGKMVDLGSSSQRQIDDPMLIRYACYLIAQKGDPKKEKVAFAQTGGNQDFAIIRSKGDQALFGKTTQAMKAQWKVPENQPPADFAPIVILKAKDFAAEITIFNARAQGMSSEVRISSEHVANNEAVRSTLLERGIRPESLPPAEDVKKVERRLGAEEKKAIKDGGKLVGE